LEVHSQNGNENELETKASSDTESKESDLELINEPDEITVIKVTIPQITSPKEVQKTKEIAVEIDQATLKEDTIEIEVIIPQKVEKTHSLRDAEDSIKKVAVPQVDAVHEKIIDGGTQHFLCFIC